jgi:hypothetical protein
MKMATSEVRRHSPYQGLLLYDEDDKPFFFGREKETRLISANMFASSLTLLYGMSGVGKSSVLRAGVAHQLRQRDDFLIVLFNRWQTDPLAELQAAVAALAEQGIAAQAFHYLVTPSGSKIAHSLKDLSDYTEVAQAKLQPVLVQLSSGEQSILRAVAPPDDPQAPPRYEIFHDVLATPILDWRARFIQAKKWVQADEQLERKRATRLRLLFFGACIVLVALVVLVFYSLSMRARTITQQNIALSRELAASATKVLPDDAELSVLLSAQAVRTARTEQAEEIFRASLLKLPTMFTLSNHKDALLTPSSALTARWS